MARFERTDVEYSVYGGGGNAETYLESWAFMYAAQEFEGSAKRLSVRIDDEITLEFTGSFKYDDTNMPKAGFFSSFSYYENGVKMYSLSDFHLTVKDYYANVNSTYHVSSLYEEVFKGTDKIIGGVTDDVLWGDDGYNNEGRGDLLSGGDGNDDLMGRYGNDRLVGGLGRDELDGGMGADRFIFNSVSESVASFQAGDLGYDDIEWLDSKFDRIVDFLQEHHDKIDVSRIDADVTKAGNQAFKFAGVDKDPGIGELSYYQADDGREYVIANTGDGDNRLKFIVSDTEINYVVLHTNDFIL